MPLLDSVINKHLDVMDELKTGIEKDINDLMTDIDIDIVIDNPEEAMLAVVEIFQEVLLDKYAKTAVEEGIKLSKAIKKDGEIVVADTDNTKLNEDII